MPSTTSSWVSSVFDSSTVMTPSLPTFFIASAIMEPMVESLLALTVPTWLIISPWTGLESLSSSPLPRSPVFGSTAPQTVATAFSIDRLRENGGGGGAVAGDVGGLGSDFLHHLRAHVLERVFQFDFFCDGDAVLGDGRRTEFL